MSVQVFVQGRLLGVEEYLLAGEQDGAASQQLFAGRSQWVSLLSEVLPRALLAELGLSRMLLGSSGGDQFFVVLPDEVRQYAETFLEKAAAEVESLSGGHVRLIWSATENLGDWSDVRKRLQEQLTRKRNSPAAPAVVPPPAPVVVELSNLATLEAAAEAAAARQGAALRAPGVEAALREPTEEAQPVESVLEPLPAAPAAAPAETLATDSVAAESASAEPEAAEPVEAAPAAGPAETLATDSVAAESASPEPEAVDPVEAAPAAAPAETSATDSVAAESASPEPEAVEPVEAAPAAAPAETSATDSVAAESASPEPEAVEPVEAAPGAGPAETSATDSVAAAAAPAEPEAAEPQGDVPGAAAAPATPRLEEAPKPPAASTPAAPRPAPPEPVRFTASPARPGLFDPFIAAGRAQEPAYFAAELGNSLREAESVGWSPETPGRVLLGGGKHSWPLSANQDGIVLARHMALTDDGGAPASTRLLARRSVGRHTYGVLRGDVDNFGIRLRRAQSIEEHIQISVLYKQFFAGELEVLCSMPEFWRKVTLLYCGGDDFAVYGAWDALILLAREVQRLFARFAEENLKEYPGPEGKTITMAMAVAPDAGASLESVFEEAGRNLEIAKSADKDCFYLFGSTVEWKQLATASELKTTMARMVTEFGCPPQYLDELGSFYRENARPLSERLTRRARREHSDRPWRYHRRIVIATEAGTRGAGRGREFEKLRTSLIGDLIGKSPAQVKLRPAGKVALEWAKLLTEV